jgi:hypothetical protein
VEGEGEEGGRRGRGRVSPELRGRDGGAPARPYRGRSGGPWASRRRLVMEAGRATHVLAWGGGVRRPPNSTAGAAGDRAGGQRRGRAPGGGRRGGGGDKVALVTFYFLSLKRRVRLPFATPARSWPLSRECERQSRRPCSGSTTKGHTGFPALAGRTRPLPREGACTVWTLSPPIASRKGNFLI